MLPHRQRLPRRDPQLPLDQVQPGDQLGDGVLHLQPRVHLHEEELRRRLVGHQELDGPRADVADAAGDVAGRLADALPRDLVEQRRRRLLDDLLVPTLQRALPLAQVDDVLEGVGQQLHLDVPRALTRRSSSSVSSPNAAAATRRAPARASARSSARSTTVMPFPPPPADGLTSSGYPTRSAAAASIDDEPGTGNRHPRGADVLLGADLVAHDLQGLDPGADEHDARRLARPRQVRVLGEEPVAGVDRIGAGAGPPRRAGPIEVALDGGRWPIRTASSATRHVQGVPSASV